ncbi:MAG: (Fe-S)-binding protein [Anaerolineae bacterium]
MSVLIESYDLEVTSPPCEPGAERWSAFARLTTDIGDVLPYLNATWKGAIYDHQARFLTWRMGGRAVSVRPYEIAVSNLEDREEAATVIERLVGMINRTWERRDEIEPSTVKRERLTALAVYKLLPGGNCKECGELTCFIFASKLVASQVTVEQCTPLFTKEHIEKREQLLALIQTTV